MLELFSNFISNLLSTSSSFPEISPDFLPRPAGAPAGSFRARPLSIKGNEGMVVSLAKCCRPIPGDPILGFINKGKGLVIHTHDCPSIAKFRRDPDKWLDVEWDPETRRLFNVNLRLVVANQRGVLAKVAAAIADAGSNIDNVGMEESDNSAYTNMHFTVQVEDRNHLAQLMKRLRTVTEVVRISRVKGATTEHNKPSSRE